MALNRLEKLHFLPDGCVASRRKLLTYNSTLRIFFSATPCPRTKSKVFQAVFCFAPEMVIFLMGGVLRGI